jgi:hypothetical protein
MTLRIQWFSTLDPGTCAFCGTAVDEFAANTDLWPLRFPHPDGTGHARDHHYKCVRDRLFGASIGPETVASHVHLWQRGCVDGAVCACGIYADDWYCPESPDHVCHYDDGDFDQCDFCGQPEERK